MPLSALRPGSCSQRAEAFLAGLSQAAGAPKGLVRKHTSAPCSVFPVDGLPL